MKILCSLVISHFLVILLPIKSMMGGMMDPNMMMQGGMMGPGMMGPSMEEQIAEAKPMLKNIDTTTKKFIDTHCHIDVMYKKEQYDGDWETYM